MRIRRNTILALMCFLTCCISLDLSAQRTQKDTIDRLMFSFSALSFIGNFPSLQGGVLYRLNSKTALDVEFSYLYPKVTRRTVNHNIGFIIKAGYLRRIADTKNHFVARLYLRNSQFLGREEFVRFGGEYIERIDFHTVANHFGSTIGALRHISGDVGDFQFGLSFGIGKLFSSGELPQDTELIDGRNGFRVRNDLIEQKSFEGILYADFKFLF